FGRSTIILVAAALLASCSSSSDPITRLGLAPEALAVAVADGGDFATSGADSPYVFASEEGEQPEQAASVPAPRPAPRPDEAQPAAGAPEQKEPQGVAAANAAPEDTPAETSESVVASASPDSL